MAARKMKDYTPYKIYWSIMLHLSMTYKGNIRYSKEYESLIQKHIEILKHEDK